MDGLDSQLESVGSGYFTKPATSRQVDEGKYVDSASYE